MFRNHSMIERLIQLLTENMPATSLSFIALFIHLATNLIGGYGYFRDEFYYIACSENLAWGFVDHPPLSIIILWLNRMLLGDSLFALRHRQGFPHGWHGRLCVVAISRIGLGSIKLNDKQSCRGAWAFGESGSGARHVGYKFREIVAAGWIDRRVISTQFQN